MGHNILNYCTVCSCDFASVSAFDFHRTGKHEYTFAEGLRMTPPREDGRRCLDRDEMIEKGLALDSRGRWHIVADAERFRRYTSGVRMGAEKPSEGSGQVQTQGTLF